MWFAWALHLWIPPFGRVLVRLSNIAETCLAMSVCSLFSLNGIGDWRWPNGIQLRARTLTGRCWAGRDIASWFSTRLCIEFGWILPPAGQNRKVYRPTANRPNKLRDVQGNWDIFRTVAHSVQLAGSAICAPNASKTKRRAPVAAHTIPTCAVSLPSWTSERDLRISRRKESSTPAVATTVPTWRRHPLTKRGDHRKSWKKLPPTPTQVLFASRRDSPVTCVKTSSS